MTKGSWLTGFIMTWNPTPPGVGGVGASRWVGSGEFHDATPFRFEKSPLGGERAIDCFGEKLRASGYAYLGSEPVRRICLG